MGQYGLAGLKHTEVEIRSARRGYLGSATYVDRKIAEVMTALSAAGAADETIVILTSDHGDMLGDKGLWMKKVFYEGSLGIPLVFHSPSRFGAARLSSVVSLVDLLPTILGFAAMDGHDIIEPVEPLDGADLSGAILAGKEPEERPLYAELTCEGTPGPVLMIRRGGLKYIWNAIDPEMMFDLTTDPDEARNLAGEPEHQLVIEDFRREVAEQWDVDRLTRSIRRSQARRRLVQHAHHCNGTAPDWDYAESDTPDARWMRGQSTYNDWAYGSIDR